MKIGRSPRLQFRFCRFCGGVGCLACPGEYDRAVTVSRIAMASGLRAYILDPSERNRFGNLDDYIHPDQFRDMTGLTLPDNPESETVWFTGTRADGVEIKVYVNGSIWVKGRYILLRVGLPPNDLPAAKEDVGRIMMIDLRDMEQARIAKDQAIDGATMEDRMSHLELDEEPTDDQEE